MRRKLLPLYMLFILLCSCKSSNKNNIEKLKNNTVSKLKQETPEAKVLNDLILKIDTLTPKSLNRLQLSEYLQAGYAWENAANEAMSQNIYTQATEKKWYYDSLITKFKANNQPQDSTKIKGYMVSAVLNYTTIAKEKASVACIIFYDNDFAVVPKTTFFLPLEKPAGSLEKPAYYKLPPLSEDQLNVAKASFGGYYFDLRKDNN